MQKLIEDEMLNTPKNKFLRLEIDTVFIPILYYITLYLIFSIYNSKILFNIYAKYFAVSSGVQVLYIFY